ncbi:mavicyanin-like [Melia azedarach]|uniref:Mavicyanin-like n=1 Tax=Melia azedarach TaxID=155640 RepID=A0ACC1XG25_MELAZ|nr:mavicyanin-like [Melia azedarach]
MDFAKKVVALWVMTSLFGFSFCAVHKVGDSAGWTLIGNVDYNKWSSSNNFHVGDTIVFEYNNQFHNVKQVTHQDFQSCNATSAIAVYTTGSDSIALKTPGHYYFLCGFPGHCEAGQKLDIMVAPASLNPSSSPRSSAGSSSHNSPHPDDQIQRNSASSLQTLSFKLWLVLVSIATFVIGLAF